MLSQMTQLLGSCGARRRMTVGGSRPTVFGVGLEAEAVGVGCPGAGPERRKRVNWVGEVVLLAAAAGAAYYALSTLAIVVLFRGKRPSPVGEPRPKVSVLKPVRGMDRDAYANFASYLAQDYPDYEVLFGLLESDDPAIDVILDTIQGNKHASLHIGTTIRGANNKVRILHQLAKHAGGEIIVVTDADTRVEPHFLNAITAPFEDESVGVVTCVYRGIEAQGVADALEGLHMTCIFAPGVACARSLWGGIDFGLGAAIAIRADVLREIGGFEPIADYLADDFQLGRRAALLRHRVELSRYVMDVVLSGEGLRKVLARELRWSRTTKVSRPLGHLGLVFTFGLAYATAYLACTGFAAAGWEALAWVAAVRLTTAALTARRLGDRAFVRRIWLLPLRDVLSFGIWVAGYCGATVNWRGRTLRLTKDGRMALPPKPAV